MSSSITSTSSTSTASHSSASSKSYQAPSSLKVITWSSAYPRTPQLTVTSQVVGIVLAVVSGVLIGSSFVFKKKGLLRSQAGHAAGEGVAYLKSVCYLLFSRALPKLTNSQVLWWSGMISVFIFRVFMVLG
jgi:magnesium transporter